ncbi:DUF6503 family protein [Pontimicrobium aquaticum]|uniref:Uncharacterized protein n=1 Tax=Pontimicrobium aquaticum TaxID=2565367 RepID=A0A4U0ESB3_9FLAO|nr:DUF6503 family protein [Pontimicrobium aquaticum]TJY34637.1 hypothetical protein E5167_10015 [Pontimicrobium aquaticum]
MKSFFTSFIIVILLFTSCKDVPLTGNMLLDKAINYHDPNGNWNAFDATFNVHMETPNSSDRLSTISINLPEDVFSLTATRDTITTKYNLNKGECTIGLNDSTNIAEATAKAYNLSCDRANMYKNYYTYLYGLPMKLKDPGTHIAKTVETKTFKGKEYLVLKATYDKDVGTDIWYFYFNPDTYAMEVYQFFKQDDNGNQKDDTGEYIVLTEEAMVNGIKMPKKRAWYYNKDDGYLGTDILE